MAVGLTPPLRHQVQNLPGGAGSQQGGQRARRPCGVDPPPCGVDPPPRHFPCRHQPSPGSTPSRGVRGAARLNIAPYLRLLFACPRRKRVPSRVSGVPPPGYSGPRSAAPRPGLPSGSPQGQWTRYARESGSGRGSPALNRLESGAYGNRQYSLGWRDQRRPRAAGGGPGAPQGTGVLEDDFTLAG